MIKINLKSILQKIKEFELAKTDIFTLSDKEATFAEKLYRARITPEEYAFEKAWRPGYKEEALENLLLHIAARNKIVNMAKYDPVTEVLYDPRAFGVLADKSFEKAIAEGKDVSQIFFDVDHFGRVNEEFTHHDATEFLRRIGHIIAGEIGMPRPRYVYETVEIIHKWMGPKLEDTLEDFLRRQATPADFATLITRYQAGRVGGEEFIAILYGKPLEVALGVAENIRTKVESEFSQVRKGTVQGITISAGVQSLSEFDRYRKAEQSVLAERGKQVAPASPRVGVEKHADAACEVAKEDFGRNKVVGFGRVAKAFLDLSEESRKRIANNLDLEPQELSAVLREINY